MQVNGLTPPTGTKAGKTFGVNVRDDQPDLIHMRRQHHLLARLRFLFINGDQISKRINGHVIGKTFDLTADNLAYLLFVSGRTVALD